MIKKTNHLAAIVIPVIGQEKHLILAKEPYKEIKAVLVEMIGESPEHVAVLYNGQRRDMFVGEDSANGTKVRNMRATEIYRNNTVQQMPPGFDPEELPACYGIAVLFPEEIVWK